MASFLKKIGKGISRVGKTVGHIAEKAAPFAGLIPGVGPLAGLAIGAGGSILAGHNLANTVKEGALGAASGLAGSKLRGGIGSIASRVLGSGGAPATAGGAAPGGDAAAGSGALGSIGALVAAARAHGVSIGDILQGGLAAAGGISGAVSAAKAGKKMDQAVGRQSAIADQLSSSGSAMQKAASAGLLARLAQGPGRFVDRSNPFSANYGPPPAAPVGPPPAPLNAPAAPLMLPPPNVIPPSRRLALPAVA